MRIPVTAYYTPVSPALASVATDSMMSSNVTIKCPFVYVICVDAMQVAVHVYIVIHVE